MTSARWQIHFHPKPMRTQPQSACASRAPSFVRRRFFVWLRLLRALLEVEDRRGDGEAPAFHKVHIHGDDAAAVGVDADVVAEEDAVLAGERLLVDLVVDERLAAVD